MRPAVFLDRDDTLVSNREATAGTAHPGDLLDPALVRLLPGAAPACRRLHDAGWTLVVITNQAGVADRFCTLDDVEAVNDRLRELLPMLDAVYYSPAYEEGVVPRFTRADAWRKPGPGMILAAAEELELDLAASWLVGDAERDIQSGIAAGLSPGRCLRIGRGMPAADLAAAAEIILR